MLTRIMPCGRDERTLCFACYVRGSGWVIFRQGRKRVGQGKKVVSGILVDGINGIIQDLDRCFVRRARRGGRVEMILYLVLGLVNGFLGNGYCRYGRRRAKQQGKTACRVGGGLLT